MTTNTFRPEVWSAQLLSILAKRLVFAGAPCVNRNYEGDISAFGDTVHINSVADVAVVDYTPYTDLTIDALTTSDQTLVIDQAKAFAFEIDDIDMRQVRAGGALMSEAASRSAFSLADAADQYAAGLMWNAATNDLGEIDGTTPTNVYDELIVPAGVKLDEANVPTEGRFMVLAPAAYGKLQLDDRFIRANESGTAALHNGVVGAANGFQILKSNNSPTTDRAITTSIAVATTAKTLTSATAVFKQSDVGSTVAGTNIAAGSKIASVSADGKVATMDTNGSAAASQTDTVLSAGNKLAIAGSAIATSYAEQISKVEAFRPQARFTDALKGLHLYGGKVVRPEALVMASVKTA